MTLAQTVSRPGVLLLAAALPLLGACGTDSAAPSSGVGGAAGSSASSSSALASSPSSSPAETPSSAPANTPSETPSSSSSSDDQGGGAPAASDAKYCAALKSAEKEISSLTKGSPTPEILNKFVNAVTKVEDAAPDRIKPAWTEFRQLVQKAAEGNTAAIKDGAAKVSSLGDKVSADAAKNCGFKF